MKLKKKHQELRKHLAGLIDRARWPDYEITDERLSAFVQRESDGTGSVDEPLLWAKKTEEITIQQQWFEMAEAWSIGAGWWCIWRDNLSRAWANRNGSNIWVRKLIAQKRLIAKHGGFLGAMSNCTAFSREDVARYCDRWLAYHE